MTSASHADHKWIVWLDLQDERRGRPSFCYPVELSAGVRPARARDPERATLMLLDAGFVASRCL